MANLFSPRLWKKDFICICLICMIASFTTAVEMSILPVYVLDLGGSNVDTGMMTSCMTVLGLVTRIVVAPLIDRLGRKPLLILGSGLFFLNALAFCFTSDLTVLFLLRVLCGFTQGVFFPVPPIMTADCVPEDLLVDGVGLFGVSSSVTFAIAPTVGLAIYEAFGTGVIFAISAGAALISFLLSFVMGEHYQKPASVPQAEKKARPAFRLDRTFLMMVLMPSVVTFFLSMGGSAYNNFLTPCSLFRGIEQIGLFFLVNHIAAIIARLFVGQAIRMVSRRVCIFAGILLCSAGGVLLGFSYGIVPVLTAAVLIGIGGAVVNQLLQVQVMTAVPEERRGVANSAFMLMSDFGNGTGSAVWGSLSASAGYTLTFFLSGAAALLGCVFHGLSSGKPKEGTKAPPLHQECTN